MRFSSSLSLMSALGLSALVAGCMGVDGGARRIGPVGSAQGGVEGSWVDESGVGVSTFANGVFTTTAADNGNRLSEGTYRMNGPQMVSITGTSLIRQQPIAFNCNVASTTQLNCTSGEGNRFVLTRRS